MRVGDVPINAPGARVREFYVQTHVNATLNVASQPFHNYVGTFTTPFACAVMVNAWARYHTPLNTDTFIVVSASDVYGSPLASNRPGPGAQDGIINTYQCVMDVPYSFYYPSIAAGTAVTMYARSGLAISSPLFEWNLCLVRCIRL